MSEISRTYTTAQGCMVSEKLVPMANGGVHLIVHLATDPKFLPELQPDLPRRGWCQKCESQFDLRRSGLLPWHTTLDGVICPGSEKEPVIGAMLP